jgi:hypothetical protein
MAKGTKAGGGRYIRNPANVKRDIEAANLRGQGHSFERIASELGYASRGKAYEGVQRALAEIPREGVEELRQMELERLDRLYLAALEVLGRKHLTVSHGKVITRFAGVERDGDGIERLDADGQTIPIYEDVLDDGPILQAIDRALKIQERRAKLLGLDAPAKLEVFTIDAIDAEIKKLQAEFDERAASGQIDAS